MYENPVVSYPAVLPALKMPPALSRIETFDPDVVCPGDPEPPSLGLRHPVPVRHVPPDTERGLPARVAGLLAQLR
eukprot:5945290-Pyramimonas_sp.AAC.1